jgi:TPR repeat protein
MLFCISLVGQLSETSRGYQPKLIVAAADPGEIAAQCNDSLILSKGDSIPINKSLVAHCLKLVADQGDAVAQFHYDFLLSKGDGLPINKSLAAHSYKLAADQAHAAVRFNYAVLPVLHRLTSDTKDGYYASIHVTYSHHLHLNSIGKHFEDLSVDFQKS